MANYIFDLDGTLIDSSERMYALFCDLVPECTLTKAEYWLYKRNKINHQKILEIIAPKFSYEDFNSLWMDRIESKYYLQMDCNYSDTIVVLNRLKNDGNKLFLLTARQLSESLYEELNKLNLLSYFEKVMITEGKWTKEEMILEYAKNNPTILDKSNVFVSDMGKDILIGKKFKYKTIGISHGFMSEEKLKEYNPDVIIRELSEVLYY